MPLNNDRLLHLLPESLEPRQLMAAQLIAPITNTAGDPSGAATTVDLSPFFADSGHTFLNFTTELGSYRVQLFDEQKPATVANFLKYVTTKRLDGTLIHRVDTLDPQDLPNPITVAPEIIQGGGFGFPGFNQIKTSKPVVNEAAVNGVISNTRGTIAMARTDDPNSATSEWFVNTTDNPGLDPGGFSPAGFAVFGKVVPADMTVVDAIGAVPRFNFDPNNTGANPFSRLPLRNFTLADFNNATIPGPSHVITTSSIAVIPDVLSYSVSSSDPSMVSPSISNGSLVLNYGSTLGSAQITVTATALDGTTASGTFNAGVGQLDLLVGGTGNARSVTVTDSDGTSSAISIKGAGTATVRVKGSAITQANNKGRISVGGANVVIDTVAMTGTDGGSTLTISSKGGSVAGAEVGGISSGGAIRSISAKGTTITRGLTTVGAVGAVTVAGATGASINLGGTALDAAATLSLGTLINTDVVANAPVKSLKIVSASTQTAQAIVLTGAQSVSVAGDLGEDIVATGNTNIGSLSVGGNLTGDVTARQIGKITVKGDMIGGTIAANLSAGDFPDAVTANAKANLAIGSLAVRGAMTNAAVKSAGSVGSISAGSISGSLITAGAPALTGLPTILADLTTPATLNTLKVGGVFAGSSVAARFLGKISIGALQASNGGTPFGFAADTIVSLTGKTDGGQKLVVKNVDTQAAADAALTGVTLGDALVRVL